MTEGLKRKSSCSNYSIILGKKISNRTHNILILMFGLTETSHYQLRDIIPSESQHAIHIYYVKYENASTSTRISCDLGGGGDSVKNTFSVFLYF